MGSRIPPPAPDALRAVEGLVTRLRAEVSGATDRPRKARLLYEIAELEERAGDEPAAARDYLAAFNADGAFREPLEGLVRLLERRRSLRNLGKLVDALVRAAITPEESARALTLRAYFLEDQGGDVEGAKVAAEEATRADAPPAEAATAWLTLELLASKVGDTKGRLRALEARTLHAADPTWRALLLLDAARLLAGAGESERAMDALRRALAEKSGATFAAAVVMERLARNAGGPQAEGATPPAESAESHAARTRAYAEALEAQASLIQDAIASPPRGEALGVPQWTCKPMYMVDAWLRAAEARGEAGDLPAAAALLDRARAAIGELGGSSLEPQLLSARMRIAEKTGDTALAAELAQKRLETETDGGVAAALAMRVAEHAASEGDVTRALAALSKAVGHDSACIPARALQLDLLADGGDASLFAGQLEAFAEHLASDDGRGRAYLLAAYVWAVRARDTDSAKAALTQAAMFGVAPATSARMARMLASVTGDLVWYEEATRRLVASSADPRSAPLGDDELPSLWLDLVRTRFARGDTEGAQKALRELGATAKGGWLGRALEAFLPAQTQTEAEEERRRSALDELAQRVDGDVARGLTLMAAMRAHKAGDLEGTRLRLRELAASKPSDVLVAGYLADLERAGGAHKEASSVAASCAAGTDDPILAAALNLEAGFERWRAGDKRAAVDAFEEASPGAPEAARAALAWGARGIDIDTPQGRRNAIVRTLEAGDDPHAAALERFANEIAAAPSGEADAGEAASALDALEDQAGGAFAIAAALARLAWPPGDEDPAAVRAALEKIAALGEEANGLAATETVRLARSGSAEDLVDATRAWFHSGGGLAAGVEWLAATFALNQPDEEYAARRALALGLGGEMREAMLASAVLLQSASSPDDAGAMLVASSDAARLANLELAPPGCDPRRRIAALTDLNGALGDSAQVDALSLAGWSWLVDGNAAEALVAFDKVCEAREDDLGAWEGLRTAAERTGDKSRRAKACEQLGARCADASRGAMFWEQAALLWLELGDELRTEAALEASFARDAHRAVAFDKLFRRVRDRKDGEKLLTLIARRLDATDDPHEIGKLFWEQARVLREKGDQEGALKALENVTMLEPDHVGALALTGEINIRRGNFEEAATALSRLALLDEAPAKSRVTAGVAAVDLYENKLNKSERALEILVALHKAKLSSLPVRERLARAAARTGSWTEATAILEELMHERAEQDGRIEAARLAMAIHRDRLQSPAGARAAIVKLLEESPMDGEALDMLLTTEHEPNVRQRLLERARVALLESVDRRPVDLPAARRLAKVSRALGDDSLQQAALSAMLVQGGHDAQAEQIFAQLSSRKPRTPQIALTDAIFKRVIDPGDKGPIADLFQLLGPTLAEALGPSLAACGVTKKDKVDPRSGIALRNEIAAWSGAFGIKEFDLYVGGKDPLGVQGVPGEMPSLVVGAGVNAPLSPATRARVARELIAMVRGSTVVRHRDDTTIAAIVVAACNIAEVRIDSPPYAMLADVERLISKAIARKTKKLLPDVCKAIVTSGGDAKVWARRALSTHNRVALVACGDVGVVLSDVLGEPLERLAAAVKVDGRAEELLRFLLSPVYIELRRSLGLEGGA